MTVSTDDYKQKATRIFCIGRNYVAHAKELQSEIPTTPVIFMKPTTCLVAPGENVRYPKHGNELHHEAELVIQIGQEGRVTTEEEAHTFISAFTLGLDLTLRDIQDGLKQKGLPWEISKAFEQSSPIGEFVIYDKSINLNAISFECKVNNEIRQQGNTDHMIFAIETLLIELSKIWLLKPGDLIYTGTPAGVGRIDNYLYVFAPPKSPEGGLEWC
jgi:2-keto-4-pentenoate hydratase/2-oxohepta-3-ene-1,7-dioic acid hydratase in catechol pathway